MGLRVFGSSLWLRFFERSGLGDKERGGEGKVRGDLALRDLRVSVGR